MQDIVKNKHLYSGKAKTLFTTNHPGYLIVQFRDDATAFNGQKQAKLSQKGKINNKLNSHIMQHLEKHNIPTHFVKMWSEEEALIKRLDMIPLECVIRNRVAGSLAKRFGVEEGRSLKSPIFEFYLKNDDLNDPMLNEDHILSFNIAKETEIQKMRALSHEINKILIELFQNKGLELIDFKLEFGRFEGEITLGDEITPDGCRIWDTKTQEKLDKDRFRRDLGRVIESYTIVADRLIDA